jgi:2-hydroxychromene-2-carboxylate isomerase
MSLPVDVFWSFRSPYSYLATPDMLALERDYEVTVNLRVVLPLAVRDPELLFSQSNAKKMRYILTDYPRRAEMLGLPYGPLSPDPIVQDMQTLKIAEQQPYIHRLSHLGVEAQRRGRGIQYAAEVARVIWSGTQDWHIGDHLARAAARAGLDHASMETAVADGDHAAEIERNHAALEAAGHWGVPTYVVANEPFFGQDRIDTLRWRLDRMGVPRRQ